MSDLRDLMDGVATDLATVRWASADELRRRVRRRRARTTAAVAGAVIAVTVGVAAVAGTRAEPSPPPAGPPPVVTGPSDAAPVKIPSSVLLKADEVGADPDSQYDQPDASEPVHLDELDFCRRPRLPAEAPRFAVGVTHMTGDKQNRPPMPFVLGQRVYRFGGTDADAFLRDLRSAVAACGSQTKTGDGMVDGKMMKVTVDYSWSTTSDHFTSDDALLVRLDVRSRDAKTGDPLRKTASEYVAYVRTGDLVTRISAKRGTPVEELRRLATLAGTRLCAAAQPRC
ncbi:hypothetical protein [Actinoplanes sp. NPDC049265]|uniref:hypothetical protein n=1 Tax=Actinoplanes sp. NPDC049265 TaxID=3363902 RepID=UPI003723D0AB